MLTDFSLKNKTTILFFMFVVFIGGIGAYFKLGKLEDPTFTIKTALIVTAYPGASPHQVEQEVTRKIEEAVQTAEEVEKIRSESRAGVSLVYVNLYENIRSKQIDQLWDILRRKVQAVQKELPSGVLPSQIHDDYGDVYGIFLTLTGDGLEEYELKKYAKYIKRELLLVKDVEKINLYGTRNEAINIEIDSSKAAFLGINPIFITEALRNQNKIAFSGSLETDDNRIRISQPGVFKSVSEIENLVLQSTPGKQIKLKDIAKLTRTYETPYDKILRFNGKEAVGIAISAKDGSNVVKMGDAVGKRLDELLETLPLGTKIEGVYYQSEFVKGAIKRFMTNLMESVAIVIAVLLISMGLRSGIIIASNLLLSILATFVVMLIVGIDLQQISLASLILVMGMIVDNAIVVTEGSQTMLQKGVDRAKASLLPAKQTSIPLLGATVIAALAFMPIYLAPNNTGEFVGSLSLVVGMSLIISWVLSVTQTPVFNFFLLKTPDTQNQPDLYSGLLYRYYKGILKFGLNNKILTISGMVLLLLLGIYGTRFIEKNFFPDSDKTQFFVDYRRPEGTKIQATSNDIKKFEEYLKTNDRIENFTSCIGEGTPRFVSSLAPEPPNPALAQIIVNVKNFEEINQIISEIEDWFKINLPQGDPHAWKYVSGPKTDYTVEARITGRDPKVLREIAGTIKDIMKKNPKAKAITDDWKERVPTVNLEYSQVKGRKAGIERQHISLATLAATDGIPVSNMREADELLPVKIKYSGENKDLDSLPVWGKTMMSVPLSQVVEQTDIEWEDPIIRRYNRRRVIRAQCDSISGVKAETLLNEIRPIVEKLELPKGYNIEWEGEFELSDVSNRGVQKNVPVCLLFMVLILVSLFNSIRQPLMIILILPFSIIGMTGGLILTNQPFGFLSILGMYSLSGMLIKNAVVLIDEINLRINSGEPRLSAVENASISRVRPVLLASLTTILGMIPLLSDPLFTAMAVTIMCGLFVATFLTLVLIPVLFTIFYKIKNSETI